MDEALTQREQDIVERLARRFPAAPPTAAIQQVMKPRGIVEALHLSWSPDLVVDVDRAIITWPPESPRRIAEAIEAQLELHGLVVSPFAVAPSAGLFSRVIASTRTHVARFALLSLRERTLVGRRVRS
ncbi:MAG: hypothetical protein AB7T32_15550 [Dehalococcoidia bacterium]